MNASALRRQLRTGGWERWAHNLADGILQEGLPLHRSRAGRHLVVVMTQDGQLEARLRTGDSETLVATEEALVLPVEKAPVRKVSRKQATVSMRLGDELVRRIDKAASRRSGDSRTALVRRAVIAYLDARKL